MKLLSVVCIVGIALSAGCLTSYSQYDTNPLPTASSNPASHPASPVHESQQFGAFPANYRPTSPVRYSDAESSTYVPMDNWVYSALDRLSSLGYLDTAFFGLRPWTRLNIVHMLQQTADKIDADTGNDEARSIYLALMKEFSGDMEGGQGLGHAELDSVYERALGIAGADPLTYSFRFGQTIINDDGRPFGSGFNNIAGIHVRAEAGRFSLNFRGEYQHAPGYGALPPSVLNLIPSMDVVTPEDTNGVGTRDQFTILDGTLSYHLWGNEISAGKDEIYWGPGQGGAMLYSDNAEPIYSFRINRVEPWYIPFISRFLGPVRYDNFLGDLKGHVHPNAPWVFGDKLSIHPFSGFEMGIARTCTFGGEGYNPVTLHTFGKCFFSVNSSKILGANADAGDRRASLDFRWRLPYMQKTVTIYTDSNADDDPNPLANVRRAGWQPGIYISHLGEDGFLNKMDLRFEAPYTNQPHNAGINYTNFSYRDGWTNKQNVIGSWIGRDSTGYQAWLTYWQTPRESIQLQYRDAKIDRALWPGGGTQTDFGIQAVKRLSSDIELKGMVQYERYLIPILKPGAQTDTSAWVKITWYPQIQKRLF